jgi:hypothetical protein
MTPIDLSDQKLPRQRVRTLVRPTSELSKSGRLFLLAVGGFLIVRIALSLLHLG